MKISIFALLCLLGFASADVEQELNYDWDNIKPRDLFVEPVGPPVVTPGLRIVGGTVAPRNGFPYQAALVIDSDSFCGGSIISDQFILTAAHCVDSANFVQVVLGAHNPRTTFNEPTQVRLAANRRIVHDGWNRMTMQNDIAVLRVTAIPNNQPGISVISLAPASAETYAESIATLTGWGRTSDTSDSLATELRTIQLPVITNAACQTTYGTLIGAQHICTSGEGARGACQSDSGGPLVVNGVEVGIVSFGANRCAGGFPSAYARVSFFRDWITNVSGV